ncbi:hypothetical protein B0H14DRAFT_2213004, partial [Mycena olivaceomarginata]
TTANPSPPCATATALSTQLLFLSSVSFENIAGRASSELLLTSFGLPIFYTFDPHSLNSSLIELHTFPTQARSPASQSTAPAVFVVIASTVNATTRHMVPGSVVLWSVDFSGHTLTPTVLARLPTSEGPNGLTTMPGHPDILLAADSYSGSIWQVNVRTGRTRMAIADDVMLPCAPAPAVGINGIHAHDNEYVCLTSSQKGVFGRVPFRVDGEGNVSASHPVEALANIQSTNAQQLPDDFVFDCEGRAWV